MNGPPEDFDGYDRARREQAFVSGLKIGILIGFVMIAVPILTLVLVLS